MIINITKPDAEIKDDDILFNDELLIASIDVEGEFKDIAGEELITHKDYNAYFDGVKAE